MTSAVAMMLGGAVVNALAFSGSNYLFSKMGRNRDEERKSLDKEMEQLQAATQAWNKKIIKRLDFINEEMKKENHAVQTFDNIDEAMKQYFYIILIHKKKKKKKPYLLFHQSQG